MCLNCEGLPLVLHTHKTQICKFNMNFGHSESCKIILHSVASIRVGILHSIMIITHKVTIHNSSITDRPEKDE